MSEVTKIKEANLYYKDGRSDKIYNITLVKFDEDKYEVIFEYGRRGNSLTRGNKGNDLSLDKAFNVFSKLYSSKIAKGYKEADFSGEDSDFSTTPEPKDIELPSVQLLNEITLEQANKLIDDDEWMMEVKYDGHRRTINKFKTEISGTALGGNRKGTVVGLSQKVIKCMEKLDINVISFDGEDMGDYILLFDVIIENLGCEDRFKILQDLFKNNTCMNKTFQLTKKASTSLAKRLLFDSVKEANGEGLVFKKKDSLYIPGRPNSGGNQLKYKFTETCSCIVIGHHESKSSISLGLHDDISGTMELINVGNATLYANLSKPKIGAIVEVKYLYAYKGGSIYQPVLLTLRDDLETNDCILSQLKFKP